MPVTNNTSEMDGSIELSREDNTPVGHLAYYRDVGSSNFALTWPYNDSNEYRFQPVAINPAFLHLAQQEAFTRAFFGFYSHRSLYEGLKAGNYVAPAKDEEKPKQSYVRLIAEAILNSPDKKLVLSEIYKTIQTKYAYFRNRGSGWKNSIRHNLSLNDCFVKLGRSPNGKGHYWTISPRHYEDFLRGSSNQRSKFQKKQAALRFCYYPSETFHYNNHYMADFPSTQVLFEHRDDYLRPEMPSEESQVNDKVEEHIVSGTQQQQQQQQHRPFDVENLLAVQPKRPVSC